MRAVNYNCQVLENISLTQSVYRLQVKWEKAYPEPKAGQFYMLRCWSEQEAPLLSRPISVHEWDKDTNTLTFLYEVRGIGTQKIAALTAQNSLNLTGPLGNGWPVEQLLNKKVALVGGGIGTAPLLQLAKELHGQGTCPDYFAGFREEPYQMEQFTTFCNQIAFSTDSGKFGHHGLVTDLFHTKEYDVICCCGPTPMMQAVTKLCMQSNTEVLVSLENKMACGIGACLGCTCHTKQDGAISVCKQGPVLKGEDVYG